jgi:hypothetical protein
MRPSILSRFGLVIAPFILLGTGAATVDPVCIVAPEGCPTRAAWQDGHVPRAAMEQLTIDRDSWEEAREGQELALRMELFAGHLTWKNGNLTGKHVESHFDDFSGQLGMFPQTATPVFLTVVILASWDQNASAVAQHGRFAAHSESGILVVDDTPTTVLATYTANGTFVHQMGNGSWEWIERGRLLRFNYTDAYLAVTGNATIEEGYFNPKRLLAALGDGAAVFLARPREGAIEGTDFLPRLAALEDDRLAWEGVVLADATGAVSHVRSYGGTVRAGGSAGAVVLDVHHPEGRDLAVLRTDRTTFPHGISNLTLDGGPVRIGADSAEVWSQGQEPVAHVASNTSAYQVTLRIPTPGRHAITLASSSDAPPGPGPSNVDVEPTQRPTERPVPWPGPMAVLVLAGAAWSRRKPSNRGRCQDED